MARPEISQPEAEADNFPKPHEWLMDEITKAAQALYPSYVSDTITEYIQLFPATGLGVYSGYEWNRVGFAAQLANGHIAFPWVSILNFLQYMLVFVML